MSGSQFTLEPRVVGLDLSLTSSGMARFDDGVVVAVDRKVSTGKRGASLADRADRVVDIANCILNFVGEELPNLVVLEGPAYGSRHGSQWDRGGLWWDVAMAIHGWAVPLAVVPPHNLKQYATGKGNADKSAVLDAVAEQYVFTGTASDWIDGPGKKDDIADAIVLAAMGSRYLGRLAEMGTPLGVQAMTKCEWPEVVVP